jgi:hypothetical protein
MRYCLLLIVCVGFLSACKSSTAPDGSNTIAGLVVLYDSTGLDSDTAAVTLSDFSGIDVSIDGTTHKTVTDRDGHFKFDNIPNGTYSITATKAGFGTYHWFEQPVVNGSVNLTQAIFSRMPQGPAGLVQVPHGPYDKDRGWDLIGQIPKRGAVAFYCDRDSNTPPGAAHLAIVCELPELIFSTDLLRSAGAHSGDTLYFTCSAVFAGPGTPYYHPTGYSYYDPIHRETRYASCGTRSNVIMGIMP